MEKTKVDNKLNVVIGTKAQIEGDTTIPENSILIATDENEQALNVEYNNTESDLDADNVQDAIDETIELLNDIELNTHGLQDILDTKSDTDHIHSEYALTTHNHDTVYSKLTHNHDSSYADISHTHDSSISVLMSQEYEELQELEKDTLYIVIDD